MFSFAGNKGSYDRLITAQPGEIYDITVVKNTAGFNDWTAAVAVDAAAEGPKPASGGSINPATPSNRTSSTGYTATKSTYETPEERAVKQIYIVRQSSISSAISLLLAGAKTPPDPDAVLEVAKKFESFVFGSTKEPVDVTTAFDELDTLDDLPQ